MSSHSRRTAALLALPFLLAGCTAAVADSNPGGASKPSAAPATPPVLPSTAPTVATIPTLDSANDQPLPLDGYLMTPAQLDKVQKAQQRLITGCMARFGFTFSPPTSIPMPRDSGAPDSRTDGRYGRQNAALSAKWGYHAEGGTPASREKPGAADALLPAQEVAALRGTSDPNQRFGPGGQLINSQKVPEHGCVGEVNQQFTGSVTGLVGDAQFANDVKFATLDASQQDQRTKAVFATWSQCMARSGYDYPDPVKAAGDQQWFKGPLPDQHELQVATADAACRHENNVVGTWYAVDFAYQQATIAANAEKMAQVKAGLEHQVQLATQTLG
ncbi:hypothetical protein [Kitasatospora azatica]|uniref:hypothetical protein n=1 Tax=Kitasatospora azatica TaxID=58347 RepID=UPI00055E4F6A|nr:hypothetical protein [Kitasatospora azatica]